MVQNVNYCWTQVQVYPLCQNHFTCNAKYFHTLLKFASTTKRIQVSNGQCVSVLFIIPVIVDIHGHSFKIYTLVSEIHENVDLVLGIKNIFELDGVINSRLLFSILEQINTNISRKRSDIKTK